MQFVSGNFRLIFIPIVLFHALLFIHLWRERASRLEALRIFVRNLARKVVTRWSDERPNSSVDEELDVLLSDLQDALSGATWEGDRVTKIREAIIVGDEPREYLYGVAFEKKLSFARTLTEAYPLLGIIGTVLAIAAGMAKVPAPSTAMNPPPAIVASTRSVTTTASSQDTSMSTDAASSVPAEDAELKQVTANFGHSVWTTMIGLSCAIAFMLWNSWWEPEFNRLVESRLAVRSVILQIKTRIGVNVPTATTRAAVEPSQVSPHGD